MWFVPCSLCSFFYIYNPENMLFTAVFLGKCRKSLNSYCLSESHPCVNIQVCTSYKSCLSQNRGNIILLFKPFWFFPPSHIQLRHHIERKCDGPPSQSVYHTYQSDIVICLRRCTQRRKWNQVGEVSKYTLYTASFYSLGRSLNAARKVKTHFQWLIHCGLVKSFPDEQHGEYLTTNTEITWT